METTDEALARLGREVKQRRDHLDLTQDQVGQRGGPSNQTVLALEKGTARAASPATLRKLDRALEWPPGTARAILGGNDAPAGTDPLGDLRQRVTELESRMQELEKEVGHGAAANTDAEGTSAKGKVNKHPVRHGRGRGGQVAREGSERP